MRWRLTLLPASMEFPYQYSRNIRKYSHISLSLCVIHKGGKKNSLHAHNNNKKKRGTCELSIHISTSPLYRERIVFNRRIYRTVRGPAMIHRRVFSRKKKKRGNKEKKEKAISYIRIIYNELGTTPFRALADDCPFCCCWCYIKKKKMCL